MEKEEVMRLQHIKQASIKYKQMALWLTAGMALAILLACRVSASCEEILPQVVKPLVVSSIFSLACSTAYGEAWKATATSSPVNLAKFYMAASGIKMMAASIVVIAYVAFDKQNVLGFAAIFALFYLVFLAFDCIYFARVEKKSKLNKE